MLFFLDFFLDNKIFILIFLFFFMKFIWKNGWSGLSYFFESFFNLYILFLTFFLFLMIFMIEVNFFILILTFFLVFFNLMFVMVSTFLFFFIFFEISSLPVMFLTLFFGVQVEKINSIFYLIFYSFLLGYFFLFFLILKLKLNFFYFMVYFSETMKLSVLVFLVLGFLMKFPVFFLHYWLPKMHVEASTIASMILAGILLKFGVHGLSRFLSSFMFVDLFFYVFLGFISIFLCCLICFILSDTKALVAYSSIVHMNLILLVFLGFSNFSKEGGFMMMMGHGFVSIMSFYFTGSLFHSYGSRLFFFNNNLFLSYFFFIVFFSMIFLMNAGIPPFLSFFCELLGGMVIFNSFNFIFFLFFFLFFFGFYFSVYFLLSFFLGKIFFNLDLFFESSLMFVLLNINFFLFM